MSFQNSLTLVVIAAVLAACGQSNSSPTSQDSSAVVDAASSQECLAAGAEAFEALTEHAAAAPVASLEVEAIGAVERASACQRNLPEDQAAELAQINARVGEFRVGHDRTALALSAVEGYRILVSAQVRSASDMPLEVALLDYAGFRYQASVRAQTPLWSEARLALDFAEAQWRAISSRISDNALKSSFVADLAAMRAALEASDASAAQNAVAVELDRVDALEQYFSPPPAQ
jgi:hypothetical protein